MTGLMRKRRTWSFNTTWLGFAVASIVLAVTVYVQGEVELAYIVGTLAIFIVGLSITREARVEGKESAWRNELVALDDGLSVFVPYLEKSFSNFVGTVHCRTKSERRVTNSWEQMFKSAQWPGGEDKPLRDWGRQFYENGSVFTQTVHDFAVAIFTTTDLLWRNEIDNWRRRTARTFDVWGERLNLDVAGFAEFLDRYEVRESYRLFLQVLAYLEIGKAQKTQSSRPPVLQGVWWLGKRWCD